MITLRTHDPIPQAAHPQRFDKCVWMESGVVNYKLCDFEYNCEACPFDQALREGTPPSDRNSSARVESKRR
jgi:hypothetical protein